MHVNSINEIYGIDPAWQPQQILLRTGKPTCQCHVYRKCDTSTKVLFPEQGGGYQPNEMAISRKWKFYDERLLITTLVEDLMESAFVPTPTLVCGSASDSRKQGNCQPTLQSVIYSCYILSNLWKINLGEA